MQTYQTKSGGGYFFAGLLFALVLGGGGYWMLHKEKLSEAVTAPRKPDITELDARAKPHFDRAKQNIPAVVEELTSYGSMVKFCYLASCDKLSGGNRTQGYLASVINARIIDPCREGAKVYGCDVNPASFQKHIAELNSDAVVASAYAASGLMLEAVFMKSTVRHSLQFWGQSVHALLLPTVQEPPVQWQMVHSPLAIRLRCYWQRAVQRGVPMISGKRRFNFIQS